MEMSREDVEKLSRMVSTDPDLRRQLMSANNQKTVVTLLMQAASSSGIAFDAASLQQWLASQPPLQEATLMEDELESVAAGYGAWDYLRDLFTGKLPRGK